MFAAHNDAYSDAVTYLTKAVEGMSEMETREFLAHVWSNPYTTRGGCLFAYTGRWVGNGDDSSCGCLTQVKSGAKFGPVKEGVCGGAKLLQRINADDRIASSCRYLSVGGLVAFAECQREIDRLLARPPFRWDEGLHQYIRG